LRNCYGFQAGVVIAALTFAHNAGAKPPFCVPDGLSDRALSDAVAGYIATTPKAAGAPAVAAIYAAMVASYPCP
jgi:hypothetical protein